MAITIPGASLSIMALVASGVTSRGEKPVPPLVKIRESLRLSVQFKRILCKVQRSSKMVYKHNYHIQPLYPPDCPLHNHTVCHLCLPPICQHGVCSCIRNGCDNHTHKGIVYVLTGQSDREDPLNTVHLCQ